jgi:hypothetical protein
LDHAAVLQARLLNAKAPSCRSATGKRQPRRTGSLNEWRKSGRAIRRRNDRNWVQTPADRQAEILGLEAGRDHGRKGTVVIIEHLASDAYGLLILAPEIPLGSGWLGGDRVVGRAAIRDLLRKAARFSADERRRLTVHLPSRAITLRLDEIEQYSGA